MQKNNTNANEANRTGERSEASAKPKKGRVLRIVLKTIERLAALFVAYKTPKTH